MVSFSEIVDFLLENYWSGWKGKNRRLAGWGKDVPLLDGIGKNIRNRKPKYASKGESARILKWKREGTGALFYENNTDGEVLWATTVARAVPTPALILNIPA